MNLKTHLMIVIVTLILGGCAGVKNRELVCTGMLQVGIYSDAFKQVWGLPNHTKVVSGDQIVSAGWGNGGGSFYKGKTHFEVWTYDNRGVELAFDVRKHRLAGWNTSKTVQELAAPDVEACQKRREAE